MPGAFTRGARIAPDFAAAAAATAGPAKRHFEWHRGSGASLTSRQGDFCAQRFHCVIAVAVERVAHPFNLVAHRGKIDCDLVGKRVVELARAPRRAFDGNPRIFDPPLILHAMHLFVA